jgi:DNA-binding HxlR family transcriptional regulator
VTARSHRKRLPRQAVLPMLAYQSDPLRESVRELGRRWTLLLLRDMAFLKLSRFGEFARNNPGLTPRVLSRRLIEMQRAQLIVRREESGSIRYRLTSRGEDAVYILLAFLRYGNRHYNGPVTPRRTLGGTPRDSTAPPP